MIDQARQSAWANFAKPWDSLKTGSLHGKNSELSMAESFHCHDSKPNGHGNCQTAECQNRRTRLPRGSRFTFQSQWPTTACMVPLLDRVGFEQPHMHTTRMSINQMARIWALTSMRGEVPTQWCSLYIWQRPSANRTRDTNRHQIL